MLILSRLAACSSGRTVKWYYARSYNNLIPLIKLETNSSIAFWNVHALPITARTRGSVLISLHFVSFAFPLVLPVNVHCLHQTHQFLVLFCHVFLLQNLFRHLCVCFGISMILKLEWFLIKQGLGFFCLKYYNHYHYQSNLFKLSTSKQTVRWSNSNLR